MPYTDWNKQREYQKLWVAKRKQEFFAENNYCVECGSNYKLELDHKDPTKKVSHRIWSWSDRRRNEELEKCQVLCRNCHRNKTNKQNNQGRDRIKHGTVHAYRYYNCKCISCLEANRDRVRNARQLSKAR